MLGEIPKTWKQGRRDDAARNELVRTLREVSELDAGRAGMLSATQRATRNRSLCLLKSAVGPESIGGGGMHRRATQGDRPCRAAAPEAAHEAALEVELPSAGAPQSVASQPVSVPDPGAAAGACACPAPLEGQHGVPWDQDRSLSSRPWRPLPSPTAWRDRILSASMAYFIGSATAPSPVAQEALQLLG